MVIARSRFASVRRHAVVLAALAAACGLAATAQAQIRYVGGPPVRPPAPAPNPPVNNGVTDRGVIDFQLNRFNIAPGRVFVLDPDCGFPGHVMEAPGAGWRQAPLGSGFRFPKPPYRNVTPLELSRTVAARPIPPGGMTNFATGLGFGGGTLGVRGPTITQILMKSDPRDLFGASCGYVTWQATFRNGPAPWALGFWYGLHLADFLPDPPGGLLSEFSASLVVTIVRDDGTVTTYPPVILAADNDTVLHNVTVANFATAIDHTRTDRNGVQLRRNGNPVVYYNGMVLNAFGPATVPAFPVVPANARFTAYATLSVIADPGVSVCLSEFTPDAFNITPPDGYNMIAAGTVYSTSFEDPAYTNSPGGDLLTGQQGWYLPPVAGSVDFNAFTYAANTPGVPDNDVSNPAANDGFVGGQSQGGTALARAQHAVPFESTDEVNGVWEVSFDVLGEFLGVLPTADFLGSFSLQPSTASRYWQTAMQWGTRLNTADHYDINYGVSVAGGPITFVSPGAAWTNLDPNEWYRQTTRWSFQTGQLLSASISGVLGVDPVTVDLRPLDWRLVNNASPYPTDIRVFAGGAAGNYTAWDNVSVKFIPGQDTCGCACDFDVSAGPGVCDIFDFLAFQNGYDAGTPCACDIDQSTGPGVCDIFDFLSFQNAFDFASQFGCP